MRVSKSTRPADAVSPNGSGSTVQRQPHRPRIVEGILQGIFSGRYPPGARLITEKLAREFGVSPTPIREAIGTLAGMGVLRVKPNCGAVVRRFTPREVQDICQVRRRLETLAIVGACGRIPTSALEALRARLVKRLRSTVRIGARDVEFARSTDTQLHDLIRRGTRNRFLSDELDRIMILVRAIRDEAWARLFSQSSPDLVFVLEEAREHLSIVEALLSGNERDARRALDRHLRSGARYIVRAVEDISP